MSTQRVHISFQRVQTWLFSVPRLRAMVGANTLLGEVLRQALPALARSGNGAWSLAPHASVGVFSNKSIDPLGAEDDPGADAKAGIFSRDGGHFDAQFTGGADAFADAASRLLRRELPGLRFSVSVGDERRPSRTASLSTELPVLEPCEWTGRGLASGSISQGNETASVSVQVAARWDAAKRSADGKSQDLASLLATKTNLASLQRPFTFEELAQKEYLAVIHADGNGVGAAGEAHYHGNRVLVRAALKAAINKMCDNAGDRRARGQAPMAPLVLLMLGGDDVLVVARASLALPFVIDLCEELDVLQDQEHNQADFRLTLGVGVAIGQPKIPFHRLHELAEELASSAKRKYRGMAEKASVVDWAVYDGSKVDDLEKVRARDWVRGTGLQARVLSQRPVAVLGDALDRLQGLSNAAANLGKAPLPPRSQLRYLVDQIPRGRTLADLAFDELSPAASRRLKNVGVSQVWTPSGSTSTGPFVTPVLDLVEVFEIPKLGSRARPVDVTRPPEQEAEVTHG